jgi:uncharacterized protein (TIGR03435 family)
MPNIALQSFTVRSTASALLLAFSITAHSSQTASQNTPPTQPAFEAASIRLVSGHSLEELQRGVGLFYVSPWGTNKFIARNVPLIALIQIAYKKDGDRISGKPDWLESQLYDVSAKAEGDAGLTIEQMRPLLRQLLEQRFHLVAHTEKKEMQGYALVEVKGGSKLVASKETHPYAQILPNGIQAQDMTLEVLASLLAKPTGRPVIDKTGIQGSYDYKLSYAPDATDDSSLPSIFTALQEQLGLRLESQKVQVETLVIDHVDKIPTEN